MQWFDVDKMGLAKILEKRGKEYVLSELIQNAWDQNITFTTVTLERVEANSRSVVVTVEDDDPNGFSNLSDAFTLFAESNKKDDPTRRGRFGFGEKTVLALCSEATIASTMGGVRFDDDGRHILRSKRKRGTVFQGRMRMTNDEIAACEVLVHRLLPPHNVVTCFNGIELEIRKPVAVLAGTLLTDIADAEGFLTRRLRKTEVWVFKPREGEIGWLYELGIPVVETGDAYHMDVRQKVPLSLNRDNVPPGYLRDLRTLVVNAMHAQLTQETANTPWVRNALADPHITNDAVSSIVRQRFGDKAVTYDPSDVEANKRAVSAGFIVVTGSQLSKNEWSNVRRAGTLLPAGKVTPSPKPFDPDGDPLLTWPQGEWTPSMIAFATKVQRIAVALLGFQVHLIISIDPDWNRRFSGAYGDRCLTLNKGSLDTGYRMTESVVSLLIHEFSHEYSDDHLSTKFYRALTDLGARLALAVAKDPSLVQ